MINSLIPYTFLAGTKARAEEINANFEAIKKELNKKGKPNGYALLDNDGYIPKENIDLENLPITGFSLFDTKISDHILTGDEAIGWIPQGLLVTMTYPDAVNKIKDLYTAGTDTTYREIACKRSTDGRYIADIAQKGAIDELFNTTGIADFYILDSANNQFYLPKTKWFQQFTLDTDLVNNYNEAWKAIVGKDSSLSNSDLFESDTVHPSSSNKLLYYKVGTCICDHALVNVGNVTSDIAMLQSTVNERANVTADNFNTDGKKTITTYGYPDFNSAVAISGNTFTAPSNGYLYVFGYNGYHRWSTDFDIIPNHKLFYCAGSWNNYAGMASLSPICKGVKITQTELSASDYTAFIPAKGEI